MGSEMLNAALEYAAAGFRVFPIKPRGKTPLLGGNWKNTATSDENQIREWWTAHPNANIAIACGHMTKGDKFITVIDMDNKPDKSVNGFRELFEWQKENGALPETLAAKSGSGGLHYYFYADKPYKNGTNILGDNSGVDVRSESGYIIAPPSVHKCGKRYEWASGFDISKIADGGAVLDKLLTERETRENTPVPMQEVQPLPISGNVTDRIVAKLGLDFGEGNRNDSIHRLASSLQGQGFADSAIIELCTRANAERCMPPLSDKEVETAIGSALKNLKKGVPRCVSAVGDFERYAERLTEKLPYIVPHEMKDGTITYSVSRTQLAAYFRAHEHYFFLDTGGEKPLAFLYSDGDYKAVDDNIFKGCIKKHIERFDENLVKSGDLDEVYKLLVTDGKNVHANELDNIESLICFKNGLLDINILELKPHSPDILCTVQIPCSWTESPKLCPRFTEYLETLTSADADFTALLWEYIGLAISNISGYLPKKALFLYGSGDTGKSQLLELMKRLVGAENYASTDLKELEEKFGTYCLWRKRLAGSPDMSAMRVSELKMFKKLTGGDDIPFERKGKDKFTDKFRGVMVFCANELPPFGGDKGEHVYERMLLCPCTNVIPPEKRDKRLIDKLFDECEGIVYGAVMALRRFINNGYNFTMPEICRRAIESYKVDNDDVLQFLNECTVIRGQNDSSIFTTTGAMLSAYKEWARINNCRYIASRSEFKKAVRDRYGDNAEIKDGSGNKRGYIFELTRAAREELGGFFNCE